MKPVCGAQELWYRPRSLTPHVSHVAGAINVGMRFVTINGNAALGVPKADILAMIQASSGACVLEFVTDQEAFSQWQEVMMYEETSDDEEDNSSDE